MRSAMPTLQASHHVRAQFLRKVSGSSSLSNTMRKAVRELAEGGILSPGSRRLRGAGERLRPLHVGRRLRSTQRRCRIAPYLQARQRERNRCHGPDRHPQSARHPTPHRHQEYREEDINCSSTASDHVCSSGLNALEASKYPAWCQNRKFETENSAASIDTLNDSRSDGTRQKKASTADPANITSSAGNIRRMRRS